MITTDELKIKVKNKAHNEYLEPQDIMQMYFFERLLYRISISEYKYNFILKGGLLLSAIIGDNRRTTQDMDTMIKGIKLEIETIKRIINDIIIIDGNDGVSFEIIKTKDIRESDVYGGIKIYLMGHKDHLQVPLSIDITTKDPITPRELEFKYRCLFEEKYISIMAFNKETIIAEKFETLISDSTQNTRAKDFYDLYMLINNYYDELDKVNLIKAIENTFKRRETLQNLDNLVYNFQLVKHSERLKNNYIRYQQKYIFAKDIYYEDVMDRVSLIIDLLTKEMISV